MRIAEPLKGNVPTVTSRAIALARTGDWRARCIDLGYGNGIVTPHRGPDDTLDAADLAAQIYATAMGEFSATGRYTGGIFTTESTGHCVPAPPEEPGGREEL